MVAGGKKPNPHWRTAIPSAHADGLVTTAITGSPTQ